jgi:hypothetical protein
VDGSLLTVVCYVMGAWVFARWLTNALRRMTGVRFGVAVALEETGLFGTAWEVPGSAIVTLYDCRSWWKWLLFVLGFGACCGSYDGGDRYPTFVVFEAWAADVIGAAFPNHHLCRMMSVPDARVITLLPGTAPRTEQEGRQGVNGA